MPKIVIDVVDRHSRSGGDGVSVCGGDGVVSVLVVVMVLWC
jgi:diacylglycerol kinase family enzyme